MKKERWIMAVAKRSIGNILCAVCALRFSAVTASGAAGPEGAHTLSVEGVVFMDANRNGQRDQGEAGVPGAFVSDGETFAETDGGGRYPLKVEVPEEVNGLTFVDRSSRVFLVNPPGTFSLTPNARQIQRSYRASSP